MDSDNQPKPTVFVLNEYMIRTLNGEIYCKDADYSIDTKKVTRGYFSNFKNALQRLIITVQDNQAELDN